MIEKNVLKILITLFVILISSCVSQTAESDTTLIPTPISPTLVPTLNAVQLGKMIQALEKYNCQLPCYLGMTPGKTSWSEAESDLLDLGATFSFDTYDSLNTIHNINLDIGEILDQEATPSSSQGITDFKIVHDLQVFEIGDTITKMKVYIDTRKFIYLFDEVWNRYSISSILKTYGLPDETFSWASSGGGYSIVLLYYSKGFAVELGGTWNLKEVCPNSETTSRYMKLVLSNPNSLNDDDTRFYRNPAIYSTFDAVFRDSFNEFYTSITFDPQSCFEAQVSR
jgi:hypothetical protein